MKLITALLASAALAATSLHASSGSVLLSDSFDGPSIDFSKWQVINPYGSSEVIQTGGAIDSIFRGTLATTDSFSAPYTVSGSFAINNDEGLFTIALRSNLAGEINYGARTGVQVIFDAHSNTVGLYTLSLFGSTFAITAPVPYSFTTGETYEYQIDDDGLNLSVAINGTQVSSGASTYFTGDKIAFFSRQWADHSVTLQSVTITSAIPEPSAAAALVGIGVLGLAITRRRRAA